MSIYTLEMAAGQTSPDMNEAQGAEYITSVVSPYNLMSSVTRDHYVKLRKYGKYLSSQA